MAVCSKCGVTVQDQNLQPDAEGKLVCRTCAGAWRAKSAQMSASQSRQEGSPGFWMPLALAASALSVLLLIIAISVGVSKGSLRKDKEKAEKTLSNLQAQQQQERIAYDEVVGERDRAQSSLTSLQTELDAVKTELADLKAGKKPPKTTASTGTGTGTGSSSTRPGTGTGTGTGTGFDFGTGTGTGTGLGTGTDTPAPADAVYANKGGKNYHTKACKYYGASSTAMTVSEARKKGLTPCRFCKPPSK